MTDADAFLEAIGAKPDDDLPRLVYADWLEERGEVTYAEFIRVDCFLSRREPQTQLERTRTRHRRHELRSKLLVEWADLFAEYGNWVLYRHDRGLFSPKTYMQTGVFIELSPKWWPRLLVEDITLTDPNGWAVELAELPYLCRLRVLCVGSEAVDPGGVVSDLVLRQLADARHLTRLEVLSVGPVAAGRATLRRLMSASYLPRLRAKDLSVRVVLSGQNSDDDYDTVGTSEFAGPTAREAVEQLLAVYGHRIPEERPAFRYEY